MSRPLVAIVGWGGIFPRATSERALWTILREGIDTASLPPPGRWVLTPPQARELDEIPLDTVRSSKACFVVDVPPLGPGLPFDAAVLEAFDPLHTLVLESARRAWCAAETRTLDRSRVGVRLACIVLPTEHASRTSEFQAWPNGPHGLKRSDRPRPVAPRSFSRWSAGMVAATVARGLGLGGSHLTLDAACASTYFALELAVRELQEHRADAMLAGGVSRPDSLFTSMGFSQLRALSPTGRCSPFDARADGLVVGEGAAMFLLKRLDDALADGDHVLATIHGIGLTNDVGGNLLAPNREGQVRAMRLAFAEAGWTPADIDLVECHATGTPVGDATELASLTEVWSEGGVSPGRCALGAVKSNVGHLLTGAGAAALAKVLLAFEAGEIPPIANFEHPSKHLQLSTSPFRIPQAPEPWPRAPVPPRVALSGFGFGGTNAHVLLEAGAPTRAHPSTAKRSSRPTIIDEAAEPIAIVGAAARIGPWRPEQLAAILLGEPLAEAPSSPWIDSFSVPLGEFRIPPRELQHALPQQILMLEVARTAIVDAGAMPDGLRTGVFIGVGLDVATTDHHLRWAAEAHARRAANDLGIPEAERASWVESTRDPVGRPLDAERTMGGLASIAASRIAREFGLGGPCFVCSSEEASGMTALELAVGALRRGTIDRAIVGAVDLLGDPRVARTWAARIPVISDSDRPWLHESERVRLGEGAVALVLERASNTHAATAYAWVRGLGGATGGPIGEPYSTVEALEAAMQRAWADARMSAVDASVVETHGSGDPREDAIERRALARVYPHAPQLANTKAKVGHCGSASGLLSVLSASLALGGGVRPGPTSESKRGATPWIRDRELGPRTAAVTSLSASGAALHAVLTAAPLSQRRVHSPNAIRFGDQPIEGLFVIEASSEAALRVELDDLARLAETSSAAAIDDLAQRWWRDHGARPDAAYGVGLVARNPPELGRLARQAASDDFVASPRLARTRSPLGPRGDLAFVFPGSGTHFPGMGRALALAFPTILAEHEAKTAKLTAQLRPDLSWTADTATQDADPRGLLLAHVALGTFASDALRSLGVVPRAAIGYSLGETSALFAMGVWTDRDEILARVEQSSLFVRDLLGPCDLARRAWDLDAQIPVEWRVGVLACTVDEVRAALAALETPRRVYLLIVNTPRECVIGGQRVDVERFVAKLGARFHPLPGITTVHCEIVQPAVAAYRALHELPARPCEGIRFYRGVDGQAYAPTRSAAADAIAAQALHGVDFPSTIEQAYRDGIRLFVELGPGSSCTRMIEQILEGRPFHAQSISKAGNDGLGTVMRVLARLVAERVAVDLTPLYGRDPVLRPPPATEPTLTLPIRPCTMPSASNPTEDSASPVTDTPAPPSWADLAKPSGTRHRARAATAARAPEHDMPTGILRLAEATGAAHGAYLELWSRRLQLYARLAEANRTRAPEVPAAAFAAAANDIPTTPKALDRAQCLEFARGSIGRVLGPAFAEIDGYPTRVRLPDEPLMLVDRILVIEGEPGSLSSGRVVTEHDVLADAWYLDAGHIPTAIAVESGQADLFLSAFLGIDRETHGHAVYRLLDAVVEFHDALPRAGQTIRYDIRIERFFRQGPTWLFRFAFEATVDGRPLLSMRDGCAGFFTQTQLEEGQGIVRSQRAVPRPAKLDPETAFVPLESLALDGVQLDALRHGDWTRAFGTAFAHITDGDLLTLPTGRLALLDRVVALEPSGGRFGGGRLYGEYDIRPNDWFLTCHFVDDPVMPGTLMYECCLHALRVFLLRMGWLGERGRASFEPIAGISSRLRCRGQVLPTTTTVGYEIEIRELGFADDTSEPFVLADATMFADGRAIVQIEDMSLRLCGVSREQLELRHRVAAGSPVRKPAIYDRNQILAFAEGKPSEAFGPPYRCFDTDRKIARLPRPPFAFIDRVTEIGGEPFVLRSGAYAEAEFDLEPEAWFFTAGRSPAIPFAVLLEAALQPCGWLAAYVGSALTSAEDLRFRNLGGRATLLRPVSARPDILRTRVRLTQVSHAGGMILEQFEFDVGSATEGPVYRGTTSFGFFSTAALAEQVGLREAPPVPQSDPSERSSLVPITAPFPDARLRMIDRIDAYDPHGGAHGLGYLHGSIDVDPSAWFFAAHFFEDPVWPGSLGLQAFLQLLQVFAVRNDLCGGDDAFATIASAPPHEWIYRGQITPRASRVVVEATITRIDRARRALWANGHLFVDGRPIYAMRDFGMEVIRR